MADPGEGSPHPLFLDQTDVQRAEKNFLETAPTPNPLVTYVHTYMFFLLLFGVFYNK